MQPVPRARGPAGRGAGGDRRRRFDQVALAWARRALGAGELLRVRPIAGGITGTVIAFDAPPRRLVLKLYRPDPSEPDSAGREAKMLELLAPTGLPVPRVVAMDREGTDSGWPALLMTRMPGRRRFRPRDVRAWLDGMARLALRVHMAAVPLDVLLPYRHWVSEPLERPPWWSDPGVWRAAVEIFRAPAPEEPVTFIHRDFHPGNVLWKGKRPSALVDWLHGCRGPVSVDIAHCRLNLWLDNGAAVADAWLEACDAVSHHPYWDIADALSWSLDAATAGLRYVRRFEAFVTAAVRRLDEGNPR